MGLSKQTGRIWYPEDFQKGNVGREQTARDKIRAALMQLVDSGRRVSVRGLERLSGCKRETIRRHADIWASLRLSNGPGDLSLLGGSPVVLVLCSDAVEEKKDVLDPLPSESLSSVLELAPISSMVFDSLRLDLSGATANNSTATKAESLSPPLLLSLATGSNTGLGVLGELVRSLNGFLPSSAKPPLGPHLPQTKIFLWDAQDANLTATVLGEHFEPVFFSDA